MQTLEVDPSFREIAKISGSLRIQGRGEEGHELPAGLPPRVVSGYAPELEVVLRDDAVRLRVWDLRTFSEYFPRATTDRLNEIPSETRPRELASEMNAGCSTPIESSAWKPSYFGS
jgi:hypothetical protein